MKRRTTRGAAAAELALLLPVVLAFCLGTVDLGRSAYVALAVNNAARVGAQQAATQSCTSYTQSTVVAAAATVSRAELAQLPDYNAANAQVTVTVVTETSTSHRVTVRCSYPFALIMPWPGLANPIVISSQVTMRRFR